jgi:hypothetical protein
MFKDFFEYRFEDETTNYLSYDSSKINLGYLMMKGDDSIGNYISPIESKFIRGYEIQGFNNNSSVGTLEYGNNIWVFYGNGDVVSGVKNIYLSVYDKSTNEIEYKGYIVSTPVISTSHTIRGLTPSMEYHTGGTITVNGSSVSGVGTSWLSDGVCSGNRIGFGSTNSSDITTWYEISSVDSNTGLTITRGLFTDGKTSNLSITANTSYVIEDFRILYAFYASTATYTGVQLLKGLRYELFNINSPTTIGVSTTVDNIRATYRLLDSATTSATFRPNGLVLLPKTNFSQQDMYVISYPSATNISIQKFNTRANLTVTAGRSDSAYVLTTASIVHNGTNTGGYNSMILGDGDNMYVTHYTRISRIPISGVTAGSTTFIADQMVENPVGTSTTFPLSSQMFQSHYLPTINRFYVSHVQGTIRNYLFEYSVGGSFEKPIHINDTVQQSSYNIFNIDTLTTNFISDPLSSVYCGGISFISRYSSDNNNILYTLPIEADKDYLNLNNSFIITPEIYTTSASTYNKVLIDYQTFYNTDRFVNPRESFDVYYRTTGITTNTGSWELLPEDGSISGSSSSIQFRFTFRTAGVYSVPTKIYGITILYDSNGIPKSITNYEPSLSETNKASQIFSWRQRTLFNTTIPNLKINIYDTSNNSLLLEDSTILNNYGYWEYSSDNGDNWNPWDNTQNNEGNYVRYNATGLTANNLIIKTILYE